MRLEISLQPVEETLAADGLGPDLTVLKSGILGREEDIGTSSFMSEPDRMRVFQYRLRFLWRWSRAEVGHYY
jgi:hypothetical protein